MHTRGCRSHHLHFLPELRAALRGGLFLRGAARQARELMHHERHDDREEYRGGSDRERCGDGKGGLIFTHRPLLPEISSAANPRLSRILLRVFEVLTDHRIGVLPIHDGVVCQ